MSNSKVVRSAYKFVPEAPTGGKADAIDRLLGAVAGLGLKTAHDLVSGEPVFLTPSQAQVVRAAVEEGEYYADALVEVLGLETPEVDPQLDLAYGVIFERSGLADVLRCVHDEIGRFWGPSDDADLCRAIIMRLTVALEDVRRARETLCEDSDSDGWLDIEAAHITLKTSIVY